MSEKPVAWHEWVSPKRGKGRTMRAHEVLMRVSRAMQAEMTAEIKTSPQDIFDLMMAWTECIPPTERPLVSHRGHIVVISTMPTDRNKKLLTVELYEKWYGLMLVHSFERVEEIPFPDPVPRELTPYVDHVPNPQVVQRWAKKMGYELDELALELMVGRWMLR